MIYNSIIEDLKLDFPEIKSWMKENDDLEGLPHCIFDMIVVPCIVEACEKDNHEFLIRISDFLEKMAVCADTRVKEILNVSVLEPLALEGEDSIIEAVEETFGKRTLKEWDYWKKRYGKEG